MLPASGYEHLTPAPICHGNISRLSYSLECRRRMTLSTRLLHPRFLILHAPLILCRVHASSRSYQCSSPPHHACTPPLKIPRSCFCQGRAVAMVVLMPRSWCCHGRAVSCCCHGRAVSCCCHGRAVVKVVLLPRSCCCQGRALAKVVRLRRSCCCGGAFVYTLNQQSGNRWPARVACMALICNVCVRVCVVVGCWWWLVASALHAHRTELRSHVYKLHTARRGCFAGGDPCFFFSTNPRARGTVPFDPQLTWASFAILAKVQMAPRFKWRHSVFLHGCPRSRLLLYSNFIGQVALVRLQVALVHRRGLLVRILVAAGVVVPQRARSPNAI
jgi:hypothetical protein